MCNSLALVLVACLVPSMLSIQVSHDSLVIKSFLQCHGSRFFSLSGIPDLQNRFSGSKRLSFLVGVCI